MPGPIVTLNEGSLKRGLRVLVRRTVERTPSGPLEEEEAMVEMCLASVSARKIEDVSEIL